MIDIENNHYRTIEIGNQIWTTENLIVTKFSNGVDIDFVSDSIQWQNATYPAQTVYQNNLANLNFGRLYNWHCIGNQICPPGWKIPSLKDWEILTEFCGGWNQAGAMLSQSDHFDARYFGIRRGIFEGLGDFIYYWSSDTDADQPHLPPPGRTSTAIKVHNLDTRVIPSLEYQIEGCYLRCIKI